MEEENLPLSIKIAFCFSFMIWIILLFVMCYFCRLLTRSPNRSVIPSPVTTTYDREAGLMRVTVFSTPLRNIMPESDDVEEVFEDAEVQVSV